MNLFNMFNSDTNVVTLALILIIILGVISYNLYYNSNYDVGGDELNCYDTIRNIFGYLPVITEIVDIIDDVVSDTKEIVSDNIKGIEDTVVEITKKKEVFNIDNNNFTYADAKLVCKAYDSELATYDQLLESHKEGSTWCNYGWSANNMALYPTQRDYYNKLQKGPKQYRTSCGKPGVNGGIFKDKELKFGVNCYGYRPEPDKSKISYNQKMYPLPEMKIEADLEKEQVDDFRRKIEAGNIQIRPFSDNKWSRYSFKKSTYMLSPTTDEDEDDKIIEIEENIKEEAKDPRNIEAVVDEEEVVEVEKSTDVL